MLEEEGERQHKCKKGLEISSGRKGIMDMQHTFTQHEKKPKLLFEGSVLMTLEPATLFIFSKELLLLLIGQGWL